MTQSLTEHDIISLLPRAPEKRSAPELYARLTAAGHQITLRSLQRRLYSLMRLHSIVCDDSSKPFGWSISADARIAMGELSVQEAVALKLGERYLAEAMPADLLDDLKGYFGLADSKLKHESLYRAWLEKIRVVPANQPLQKPAVSRNIRVNAYEGVLKGVVLNITYRSPASEQSKTYDVHPLAIVVRGNVTYLLARNTRFSKEDDIAWLALHRFQSIRLTADKVGLDDFNLDSHIAKANLGFMAEREATLRVRFYDNAGAHLAESRLSSNQKLKKTGDGEHELSARLLITAQLKWWLFGFGDRAEVLAPASLRAEFKVRLTNASRRYRTARKT